MEITSDSLKRAAAELRGSIQDRRSRASAILEEVQRSERELKLIVELLRVRGISSSETVGGESSEANLMQGAIDESNGEAPRLGDAVVDILRAAGQPLHIREVVSRVREKGLSIPGRGEPANLIVHIRTHPEIVRPVRGMYGLREWGISDSQVVGVRRRRLKRRRSQTSGSKKGH
jgi:hypothetical protein